MLSTRARWLVLLLAALTTLVLTGADAVAAMPATHDLGAQNRARALNAAAPILAPAGSTRSACSRPGFIVSTAQIAAGSCVAAEDEAGALPPIAGGSGEAQAAEDIANGHAFDKHLGEFPEVSTRQEFQQVIDNVIENPTDSKSLSNGRTAYYDSQSNTLVITDPSSADGGTAFRPTNGVGYYNGLK
jgi:hypothetical protein